MSEYKAIKRETIIKLMSEQEELRIEFLNDAEFRLKRKDIAGHNKSMAQAKTHDDIYSLLKKELEEGI